jgi:nucleoid-associated protein YgaU
MRAVQTGPFRNGAAKSFADFDQSYVPINPSTVGGAASAYTVRDGDTLQSIARQIWGDAGLWYLIAGANGLTAGSTLAGGMTLVLPNKVVNFHNSSATFRVYDPNKAIGDVRRSVPPKRCGRP